MMRAFTLPLVGRVGSRQRDRVGGARPGVGAVVQALIPEISLAPHPQPLPTRGRGAAGMRQIIEITRDFIPSPSWGGSAAKRTGWGARAAQTQTARTRTRAGLMDRASPPEGRGGAVSALMDVLGMSPRGAPRADYSIIAPALGPGLGPFRLWLRGKGRPRRFEGTRLGHRLSASWVCEPHRLRPVVVPDGRVTGHTAKWPGGHRHGHEQPARNPCLLQLIARETTSGRPPRRNRSPPTRIRPLASSPSWGEDEDYVGDFGENVKDYFL